MLNLFVHVRFIAYCNLSYLKGLIISSLIISSLLFMLGKDTICVHVELVCSRTFHSYATSHVI